MARVFNFNPGPAAMPESVLQEAQSELLDYQGSGMSVLEMSHRSPEFEEILQDAKAALKKLYRIPDNYSILFLQGGATLEFAGVPMNLMFTGHAGYIVSGNWSKKAYKEAAKYGTADLLASSEETHFDHTATISGPVDQSLDYVYLCQNETVYGTMTKELPETGSVDIVADISSMFLSCPLDISRYGMLYAGAQKNGGPAGITVLIVRNDLLEKAPARADICPQYLDWHVEAEKDSLLNTPNTFGIYLCGKVFRWVEKTGGLEAMGERNWTKMNKLYDEIDSSKLYRGLAKPEDRSISNAVFTTGSKELDAAFVAGAKERGMVGLKGHRILGGMRASCYNAVSPEAVDALIAYMKDFEQANA